MAKRKFYALLRYRDKLDGELKVGYFKREGFDVPNDFGLTFAVYRAKDETASTNYDNVKTWFVVDEDCGLSVAEGSTKKEAIQVAIGRLSKTDMEQYKKTRAKMLETYGPVPGHGVMWNSNFTSQSFLTVNL